MGRTACIEPQCLYKGALYLTFYLSQEIWKVWVQIHVRPYVKHSVTESIFTKLAFVRQFSVRKSYNEFHENVIGV